MMHNALRRVNEKKVLTIGTRVHYNGIFPNASRKVKEGGKNLYSLFMIFSKATQSDCRPMPQIISMEAKS